MPRGVEEGIIWSIAMWEVELGWRGQSDWEREFGRLQYQALRKATGAVRGTSAEKVNRMTGVRGI